MTTPQPPAEPVDEDRADTFVWQPGEVVVEEEPPPSEESQP